MKLTDEQNKLIHFNGNTILKAGPGSGKTLTISTLINQKMQNWENEHKGIAIISFCNSSVEELKEKIEEIHYPHYIGTIDGFVEKYIFYPFSPNLFFKNKNKAKIIANDDTEFFKNLKARSYYGQKCYQCKSGITDILLESNGKIKAPREECNQKDDSPCKRYKRLVLSNNLVTYDDAMSISIQILKKYPEIAKLLAQRFPLIIIDEAQDTSKIQMELIEQFEKNNSTLIIVGDADQAIYEWRRATPEIFINKYENSEYNKIEFLENHRSSQKICNATYNFSTLSRTATAVGEFKEFKEKPLVIFYDNLVQACNFFKEYCNKNNIDKDNRKVLVRGRNDIENNPYCDIQELWKNEITEKLIRVTLLKGKGKINEARDILEKTIFELIFKESIYDIDEKIQVILQKYNVEQWNSMINQFILDIPNSNIVLNEWEKLIDKKINNLLQTQNEKYIKIKRNCKDSKVKDFRNKELYYFDKEYIKSSAEIATIHSAKGKTYEAIMLVIKQRGKLTFNSLIQDNKTEEVRTAYVAMTRPKKLLVVALPKSIKKNIDKCTKFDKRLWDFIDL